MDQKKNPAWQIVQWSPEFSSANTSMITEGLLPLCSASVKLCTASVALCIASVALCVSSVDLCPISSLVCSAGLFFAHISSQYHC